MCYNLFLSLKFTCLQLGQESLSLMEATIQTLLTLAFFKTDEYVRTPQLFQPKMKHHKK